MIGSVESARVSLSFSMPRKKKAAASTAPAREESVRHRAKRLRVTLGYSTVTAFAAFLRIEQKRWYNVENGYPLSKDLALLLVQRIPGLSIDWLWLGRPDGLSLSLARRLGEAETPPETA